MIWRLAHRVGPILVFARYVNGVHTPSLYSINEDTFWGSGR